MTSPRRAVLLAANYPPGTGYAWGTIEEIFRGLAVRYSRQGRQVYLAYPRLGDSPPRQNDPNVHLVEVDAAAAGHEFSHLVRLLRVIRRHRIGLLYLTDQPTWSLRYPALFLAGIQTLVVHDRTSGTRPRRRAGFRLIKRILHRVPGLSATACIGVSRFVVDRLVSGGTPRARTHLIYNGIALQRFAEPADAALARAIGLAPTTPIVFASARAQPYKGIQVLIEAAALLAAQGDEETHFVYCGDGSGRPALEARAAELGLTRFHFLGRREDVPALLSSSTVAVVPSLWGEAFGLTVAEAMAAGVPVVCSAVGGIPELVEEGVTGHLVPPGDPAALAAILRSLLDDSTARERMGHEARRAAHARFSLDRVVEELSGLMDRVEATA